MSSSDAEVRKPGSGQSLKKFFGWLRPYLRQVIIGTVLMIVAAAGGLVMPLLTGSIVDAATRNDGIGTKLLNYTIVAIVGLSLFMAIIGYFQNYFLADAGNKLLSDMRSRLFGHLVQLGPDFYESRRVGELLSRMSSDLGTVQGTLIGTIPSGIRVLVQFISTLGIMFYLNPHLTLMAMLVIPSVAALSLRFGKLFRKLATEQQDALAGTSGMAEEVLNGIRTVQTVGQETYETDRYRGKVAALLDLQQKNVRVGGMFGALLAFVSSVAFGLVLWYGGHLVMRHELTAGQLISFLLYVGSVGNSINALGGLYTGYQVFLGASTRVVELLDMRCSIQDSPDARPLREPKGRIVFENVSFCYPKAKEKLALADINLEIEPGEIVALVGPSGAGKSTLASLLLRFYDPSSGRVRIDGADLRSVCIKDLRHAIGIVPQDVFLFDGTIEENIRYGRPDSPLVEIQAAAAAAGADDFIRELPRTYQERIGQRGTTLSCGQRQRLALARAFLRDPAILLLDEATSSQDSDSEEKIKEAISKLVRGRTTVVIAHRLTTARMANRIIVLENGRIVGDGPHDTLYETTELYRRYWNLQSLNGLNGNLFHTATKS